VLKYNICPLAEMLSEILEIARAGMGCPVEMEFSMNLGSGKEERQELSLWQIRPMAAEEALSEVEIGPWEISRAFCYSSHVLGNGRKRDLADIVYLKSDAFDTVRMPELVREIGGMNADLARNGRK
jgi:hypothetical protein